MRRGLVYTKLGEHKYSYGRLDRTITWYWLKKLDIANPPFVPVTPLNSTVDSEDTLRTEDTLRQWQQHLPYTHAAGEAKTATP
jgi:hypothetical protein